MKIRITVEAEIGGLFPEETAGGNCRSSGNALWSTGLQPLGYKRGSS